jgi:3-oxoacyl-(acyl-carrier-protein) synthase
MTARPPGVVVTGLGVVSPIGTGVEAFWAAALAGRAGTGEVTLFDTGAYLTHRGGEVPGWRGGGEGETLARSESFALAAARMALDDAGLLPAAGRPAGPEPRRTGVCFGMVMGNRPALEGPIRSGGGWVAPARTAHDATRISRLVARAFALHGPNVMLPNACASGNSAIAHGMDLIQGGRADAVVAGGADELSEAMFMMFNSFRALAPDRVQPFDRDRRGLMLGEGAGALVLESEPVARARGARIYGWVAGHGNLADAYHMTAPHPNGDGAARSMRAALAMAGVGPSEVDYVCAHGTGTPANDVAEAIAIRHVLGAAADDVPVSSIKSMLGHAQGAAGAIEAAACLLAIRDGVIPPNAHLDTLDPACAIRVAANRPLATTVTVALNNAFGFGGNNCCVVFTGRAPE